MSDKKANTSNGYVIPGRLLFGNENKERRERLFKACARYDGKQGVWICPSQQVYEQFAAELGLKPVDLAKPQGLPNPPTVAPPSGLPKAETLSVVTAPVVTEPIALEPMEQIVEKSVEPVLSVSPKAEQSVEKKTRRILELPPSFIVVQEVKVKGDITYRRLEEESSSSEDIDGTTVAKTTKKTETVIYDPAEYKEAMVLAGQLRTALRRLGQVLQSGVVIVPTSKEGELDKLISETQAKALDFNRKAKHHYIRTAMLKSLITSDTEAASRGIAYKLQETMDELRIALEECDVKRIKSIAEGAKTLTRIIPPREANTLSAALASAKQTAKWIKEELEDKGKQIETVRAEVARASFGPIDSARASFLELAGPVEMNGAMDIDTQRFASMAIEEITVGATDITIDPNRFDM